MKKFIFIFACGLISLQAQSAYYYYYKGNKVYLSVDNTQLTVYSYNNNYSLFNSSSSSTYQVKTLSRYDAALSTMRNITSAEYVIRGSNNSAVKMSNSFFVKLRSSSDLNRLKQLVSQTRTRLVGEVPNMPLWYEVIVHNSTKNNSLDMSNYFYETGYFEEIDSGFIFDFKPTANCVSDRQVSQQWGLDAINACQAWGITKGSSNVTVAVVDGGIDIGHNEFICTPFFVPYDCMTNTIRSLIIYSSHGTAVCGIIAADHNNGHVAGIAPNVSIMPVCYDFSYQGENEYEKISCLRLASGIM